DASALRLGQPSDVAMLLFEVTGVLDLGFDRLPRRAGEIDAGSRSDQLFQAADLDFRPPQVARQGQPLLRYAAHCLKEISRQRVVRVGPVGLQVALYGLAVTSSRLEGVPVGVGDRAER